jgi:hypothetical protein
MFYNRTSKLSLSLRVLWWCLQWPLGDGKGGRLGRLVAGREAKRAEASPHCRPRGQPHDDLFLHWNSREECL